MKLKTVYSIVCSEKNWYLEQLQLSLFSLRKFNPSTSVIIVCDNESRDYIFSRIKEENTQILPVPCPRDMDPMQRSRYLKVNLRSIVSGDFLYIDNDTVILRTLDEADCFPYDLAAVLDNHNGPKPQNQYLYYTLKTGKRLKMTKSRLFNSGVLLVRDTAETRRFYEEWAKVWQQFASQGVYFDQLALNQALEDRKNSGIINELPGEWNCQIARDASKEYKDKAVIAHYQDSFFNFKFDIDFEFAFKEIRESGSIPERLVKLIDDKSFPRIRYKIEPYEQTETYINSPLFVLLHHNRRFFSLLEGLSSRYIFFTLSPLGKFIWKIKKLGGR